MTDARPPARPQIWLRAEDLAGPIWCRKISAYWRPALRQRQRDLMEIPHAHSRAEPGRMGRFVKGARVIAGRWLSFDVREFERMEGRPPGRGV